MTFEEWKQKYYAIWRQNMPPKAHTTIYKRINLPLDNKKCICLSSLDTVARKDGKTKIMREPNECISLATQ